MSNAPIKAKAASAKSRAPAAAASGEESEPASPFQQLPPYSRSLLRVSVPAVVTLASTRMPISRVLELGPGAILHFDKSYDSPLTLSVGNYDVAVGEAVKIGDKFGIRISSMVMPEEKFEPVRAPQNQPRS